MTISISDTLKEIEKKFDLRIGPLGGVADSINSITSGNLAIDYVLGVGGLPLGRSIELFGPPASGKSTMALQTAAELQKVIISENRDEYILYSDFEHALDGEYATALGLDLEHPSFLVMQPDSLEQGANAALLLLDTDKIRLSIWDSVASMTPDEMVDIDKEFSSRPMGAAHKAKLMSDFLRVLNGRLHRHNCSALFLNHIMDVIETGFTAAKGIKRKTTPGGNALKFYASVRVEFQPVSQVKGKVLDLLTNEEVDRIVSTNVKVKVVKNKVASPFKECMVRVGLGKGFDNFWSAVQVLMAYGKIKKSGAYYYFDKLPDFVNDDMGFNAKGRAFLEGERNLLAYAEDHGDWALAMEKVARDLIPASHLPSPDELVAVGPLVEEPAAEFNVDDFGTPKALGFEALEDVANSADS